MEKVIREDGGSSCNGLRRQASRLMEPCSSRKALSICASIDAVGLRHSKSAASPVVISTRAGAKDRFRIFFSLPNTTMYTFSTGLS